MTRHRNTKYSEKERQRIVGQAYMEAMANDSWEKRVRVMFDTISRP